MRLADTFLQIELYTPLAYRSTMPAILQTVAETPQFLRDTAEAGLSDD